MVTKSQLKKELKKLGIATVNNRIKKSDILKILPQESPEKLTTKAELQKQLKDMGIGVTEKGIKKSDILKALGATPQELEKFKTNENNEWTVYKIPNDVDSVNGVSVRTTYDHLCTDTQWQVDEFWRQFKAMGPSNLFIYISKTRNIADPKHKIATLDEQNFVGADEQVVDTSNMNLPSVSATQLPAPTGTGAGGEPCTCDIFTIMREGCKCGAIQRERQVLNSLTSQAQLKDQLYKLNIPIYAGSKIKKADIEKALAAFTK